MIRKENFEQLKIQEIQKLEGENLQKKLPSNGILMGILNVVELWAGIWFLGNMIMFGNKIPKFILPFIATTPVVYTWVCAKYQADNHELPKYFSQKNKHYEAMLFPNPNTSKHILIEAELEHSKLMARVKNIVNEGCPYNTPESASKAKDAEYINNIIE